MVSAQPEEPANDLPDPVPKPATIATIATMATIATIATIATTEQARQEIHPLPPHFSV
jgi:hypothetical protein